MGSSFRQWESDPLFSAAEVVQDSADRMESLFRLLLHEQSLIQEHHPDEKLLKLIEYHKRDLATTLETARWQLEDFEREVNLSVTQDKSHIRENIIFSHRQFIRAIREQVQNVQKSLGDTSVGDPVKSSEWVNFDEQDRNGLALFLSGEISIERVTHHDLDDSNILRRFLDPTTASSLKDEIVEHKTNTNLNMNGFVHSDCNTDLTVDKLKAVVSDYSSQLSFGAPPSLREIAASNRNVEGGNWDLEANEASHKSFFYKNKLRRYCSRMNIFRPLGALWFRYGSRASRSFTKRWKDGEEQRDSQTYINSSHAAQGTWREMGLTTEYDRLQRLSSELFARLRWSCRWLGECRATCQRSPYFVQASRHSMQLMLKVIFALIVLGILASLLA